MGKCIEMIHTHFPWLHVVNGRPRHPQSQGMIERSHGPFKKALRQLLKEHDTEDWVPHIYSAQSAVNNRAMKSRGNLTPYSLYFGSPNTSNYGAILGPSYKLAKTEYGLRVPKMVLIRLKKHVPDRVMSQRDVEGLVRSGDELFETVSRRNQQLDWKDVKRLVAQALRRYGVEIGTDDEFEDDDTPSVQSSTDEEDDAGSTEGNTGVAAATDAAGATYNAVAAPPSGTSLEVLSTVAATAPPPPSGTGNQASSTAAATAPPPSATANRGSTTSATRAALPGGTANRASTSVTTGVARPPPSGTTTGTAGVAPPPTSVTTGVAPPPSGTTTGTTGVTANPEMDDTGKDNSNV
jgi:hypothetical protein